MKGVIRKVPAVLGAVSLLVWLFLVADGAIDALPLHHDFSSIPVPKAVREGISLVIILFFMLAMAFSFIFIPMFTYTWVKLLVDYLYPPGEQAGDIGLVSTKQNRPGLFVLVLQLGIASIFVAIALNHTLTWPPKPPNAEIVREYEHGWWLGVNHREGGTHTCRLYYHAEDFDLNFFANHFVQLKGESLPAVDLSFSFDFIKRKSLWYWGPFLNRDDEGRWVRVVISDLQSSRRGTLYVYREPASGELKLTFDPKQGWNAGKTSTRDALWILKEFANSDEGRLLMEYPSSYDLGYLAADTKIDEGTLLSVPAWEMEMEYLAEDDFKGAAAPVRDFMSCLSDLT